MKQLNEMTLKELWQLFPIVLEAPNPQWRIWANEEIKVLQSFFQKVSSAIYHIGSTAIPNIWAKPIVDLIVEVTDTTVFPLIRMKLIEAGYICMKETDTRIDFNKGYTSSGFAERVFHIHVRIKGDTDEIYFRDYLINHPKVAKEYEALKLSLWKPFEHDRDGYTDAKSSFIKHYTDKAKLMLK